MITVTINSNQYLQALPFLVSAIFHDGVDYFRIKNIPDNAESREIVRILGLEVYDSVDSIKSSARSSLASSDKRSNVV
jgi:hypothetical protein